MFSKMQINLSCHQKYVLEVHKLTEINDTTVIKGDKRGILRDKNYSKGDKIKIVFRFHIPNIPLK